MTVADLVALTEHDLFSLRWFGATHLRSVVRALTAEGLSLAGGTCGNEDCPTCRTKRGRKPYGSRAPKLSEGDKRMLARFDALPSSAQKDAQ